MQKLDTSLLCLEIASISLGYRVLSEVTSTKGLRVIEAAPACDRFVILALGPVSILGSTLEKARSSCEGGDVSLLVDSQTLADCDVGLIESIHSLPQTALGAALAVVECSTVSALLASADAMVRGHGLAPIEIKIMRSGKGGAYGFLTGAENAVTAAAEDVRSRLKDHARHGRVEVISCKDPAFRSYFEISGRN